MKCEFKDCTRKQYAKLLCQSHYKMTLRGEELRVLRPREGARLKTCTFQGCDKPHKGNNLCSGHNYQDKKFGVLSPIKSQKSGEWNDWFKHESGYIRRTRVINGKRETQAQHRYVVEQKLGRSLLPGENIHHKNGIRDDNRIQNLELWLTSQPTGQRVTDLVQWANFILDRYNDDDWEF